MDKRIESFLTRIEKQIYTEHEATLIREELLDHIDSLVEDYKENGLTYDDAVSKALLQMGDPKEIGYSFADYDGMKKRKYIMYGLKILSLISILTTVAIGLVNDSSQSDFLSIIPSLANLFDIYLILALGTIVHGHSMKFLELDTTPYLILWPTKQRFKWEYFAIALFFSPIFILLFGVYFFEEGLTTHTVLNLWPLVTCGFSIWAFMYSEKFRVPKYMVVDDGFVIKGRLVSWTSIQSYTWTKDFLSNNKENYKLIINSFSTNQNMPYKRTLHIHKKQQQHLQYILRNKF